MRPSSGLAARPNRSVVIYLASGGRGSTPSTVTGRVGSFVGDVAAREGHPDSERKRKIAVLDARRPIRVETTEARYRTEALARRKRSLKLN